MQVNSTAPPIHKHRPREQRSILDPPAVLAIVASGDVNARSVYFVCRDCNTLQHASVPTFRRVAA